MALHAFQPEKSVKIYSHEKVRKIIIKKSSDYIIMYLKKKKKLKINMKCEVFCLLGFRRVSFSLVLLIISPW